jgi:hypothetical protein
MEARCPVSESLKHVSHAFHLMRLRMGRELHRMLERNPLLDYAARNWDNHAR